jgi:uncharacterized protein (TIGR00369 family)
VAPTTISSGRSLLDAIAAGAFPRPPAADLLDLDLDEVGDGWTKFSFIADERYANPLAVHGGILAAIADFAVTTAIVTQLPSSADVVTADLHTTFLRGIPLDRCRYGCIGRVVHLGRSQANATAEIRSPDGPLHVTAVATCRIRTAH